MTATTTAYMSASQVARRLGVSHETVRRLVMRGTLPAIDTPIGRLFDPAVVELVRRDRAETDSPRHDSEVVHCRGCGVIIAYRHNDREPYRPFAEMQESGANGGAELIKHSYEPDGRLVIKCERCGTRARPSLTTRGHKRIASH